MKPILSLVFLSAAVAAQGVPAVKVPRAPSPAPQAKVPAPAEAKTVAAESVQRSVASPTKPGTRELAAATPSPFAAADFLLLDQPAPGVVFAHGRGYKAGFTADGFEFVAAPPVPELDGSRVHFALQTASVGRTGLRLGTAAPTLVGRRVAWDRGALTERVDLTPDGVEQSFVVPSLPARGELVLTLAVDTTLAGEDLGSGIAFHGDADVHYGEAVAIDANGDRVHAETRFAGGHITITVPAAFVEHAALPLVVDPYVTSATVVAVNAPLAHPDLAWDETAHVWAVVYDRVFSANDTDVYVQLMSAQLQPVGSLVTIDFTSDVWQLPRIADLNAYDEFLVVAQVSADQPPPSWIAGRILSNAGVAQSPILIEKNGVAGHGTGNCFRPDVAGDPNMTTPNYFTVVWEEEWTQGSPDHDIAMKRVGAGGYLFTASPDWVDNSPGSESHPSISKSLGGGDYQDQRFAVVYQRTFSATDEDIRAAIFDWDGTPVLVGGNTSFSLDSSVSNDILPRVSTSTLGATRRFLCAYERTTSGNGDIAMTCFTAGGVVLARDNLSALQTVWPQAWPSSAPSVDCDGTRFAVSYTSLFLGSGTDTDVYGDLVSWNGTALVVQESLALAAENTPESQSSMVSRYSGSGTAGIHYAAVDRDVQTNGVIELTAYDGYGGSFYTTRSTGCGGLNFVMVGVPAPGETVSFHVQSQHPITGTILGFPIAVPVPNCPFCVLGVDGDAVIANPATLSVPPMAGLVGLTLAAQGFTFGGGPCLATVSASDTIDFTIR